MLPDSLSFATLVSILCLPLLLSLTLGGKADWSLSELKSSEVEDYLATSFFCLKVGTTSLSKAEEASLCLVFGGTGRIDFLAAVLVNFLGSGGIWTVGSTCFLGSKTEGATLDGIGLVGFSKTGSKTDSTFECAGATFSDEIGSIDGFLEISVF